MAYRVRRSKSVQKSLRKVAGEQLDKAIAELLDQHLDRHETVHQVRRACEKLRGLIRLVRPAFPDYSTENKFFRDAARELSYVRDAQSILECYDQLVEHFRDQLDLDAFASIRQQLEERRKQVADDQVGLDQRLDEFLAKMREARGRADSWKLNDDGFSAVEGGLKKTYRPAQAGFTGRLRESQDRGFPRAPQACQVPLVPRRLLRRIWPELLHPHRDAAHRLSDLLGDDHDLVVIRTTLLDQPEAFGSEADIEAFVGLVDCRRTELEKEARPLGERLLAEKPKRLAGRFFAYWKTWRD